MEKPHSVGKCFAKGACIALAVCVVTALILILVVLVHTWAWGPDLVNAPVVRANEVVWNTGDLILTQHVAYHLTGIPIVENMPVHVGIVWDHPTYGPTVVDTHEAHQPEEQMPDALTNDRPRAGTRVVRLADYLHGYKGAIFRRPLMRGTIDAHKFRRAVEDWALFQPFDSFVAKGQPLVIAAIAAAPSMLPVARLLARVGGPMLNKDGDRLRGVFCTELVARLLQMSGAIDPSFPAHLAAPIAFTSRVQHIDKAAQRISDIAWGKEERVVIDPPL